MARGQIGSYVGKVKAGEDIIPVLGEGKSSRPHSTGFSIQKIAISGTAGLRFRVNDAEIELTETGVFETSEGMIEVKRLVFLSDADVNIRFLY